ncbi:MAG: carbon storage regulator [Oscillospiraceae bacterium]
MLVISRKLGEELIIAENTRITILDVGKDKVRIGIDAPQDVRIVRKEVYDIEKQNLKASSAIPKDIMEKLLKDSKEHKED